jgi:toxin ParE1/3/4
MGSRRRRVVWALGARDALDAALEFIAGDSPAGAKHILEATLDLAESLESLSERGRVVPELDDVSIREVFVYSYRIIDRVSEDLVEILAFLHGARDFERWQRERDRSGNG